jgi:hypothetical protein
MSDGEKMRGGPDDPGDRYSARGGPDDRGPRGDRGSGSGERGGPRDQPEFKYVRPRKEPEGLSPALVAGVLLFFGVLVGIGAWVSTREPKPAEEDKKEVKKQAEDAPEWVIEAVYNDAALSTNGGIVTAEKHLEDYPDAPNLLAVIRELERELGTEDDEPEEDFDDGGVDDQ